MIKLRTINVYNSDYGIPYWESPSNKHGEWIYIEDLKDFLLDLFTRYECVNSKQLTEELFGNEN